MVGGHAATIQDKWFARLFLVKALVFASLAVFWIASGFISLVISFSAAAEFCASMVSRRAVNPMTAVTSLMDISIGVLISFRRSRRRTDAGIMSSLGYMAGAAVMTPDLWMNRSARWSRTAPAIVLMLVALLTLDNR